MASEPEVWWPVCLSEGPNQEKPMGVRCAGRELVLFRDTTGAVRAVEDRCPHRRAPLSLGRITPGGEIQCGYHGWIFDGGSGACTRIPNLSANERVPDRYKLATYDVRESGGFVYLWVGEGQPHQLPESKMLNGFSGSHRVTIGHSDFVAALLDDPSVVLSIAGIHITQLAISDPIFMDEHIVVERGAHWGRARKTDCFTPDFSLTLTTRTHMTTGHTEVLIQDSDGKVFLEAVIACTPDRNGVLFTSWRGRIYPRAGGIYGALMRSWYALTGRKPLVVRPFLDGEALANVIAGPSITWRQQKRALEKSEAA